VHRKFRFGFVLCLKMLIFVCIFRFQNVGVRDKSPLRGDIHVLIVGDPGLGKVRLYCCMFVFL
jgi:DNA replicative helicase MCM subunit Mcm2 (Cdc46/Mcm family)